MTAWTPSERELERRAFRRRRDLRRGLLAAALTAALLVALALVVTGSPGWPSVRATYFDVDDFRATFPEILRAFGTNVVLFCIAEVLILALALTVAVVRVIPSPWLMPLRVVATVYTDLFRGMPTLLVVLLIGFGVPALGLSGTPTSPFWLGVIALTLCYGAYVAEVLRAGVLSIHPSQWASGRAIGLSYGQTLRAVVLPQAVRRVLPPLLNDFVSLQKDTALLSAIGVVEALRQAQIYSSRDFVFTPMVAAALLFVLITIPFARFTDWLALRQARREAGAAAGVAEAPEAAAT